MDEFEYRFQAAKKHRKETIEDDAREVYKFCFNGRESEWDDRLGKRDREEIFTDVPAMLAQDFYGELFTAMTPENTPWVEYEVTTDEDGAAADVGKFEQIIASSLRRSNYYSEGQTAFQDAVVGTVAAWGDRLQLNGPTVYEAVPIPQLYLRTGPFGIDDRFRAQRFCYRDLPALFPNAQWPRELLDKIKDKNSKGSARVVRGFWRTYDDPENPVWRAEVRIDGKKVGLDRDLYEEGEMPLVVGAFNPRPGWAWGVGPGILMLPTIRVLNSLSKMILEGMEKVLDPAIVYAHDGILNLEEGLEAGLGYPSAPGSAESVKMLSIDGGLDYGYFSEERIIEILREGFYQPARQRGKTPPSASQYIGEEQKDLRRLARPAGSLWEKFGVGLLKRQEFLEKQPGGLLDGVDLPLIESGTIVPRPISPLERATAREDVLVAQSIMQMAMEALGPEQAPLLIDGNKTMTNIRDKLNDKLVQFRSQEEMVAIMQAMQGGQSAPQ